MLVISWRLEIGWRRPKSGALQCWRRQKVAHYNVDAAKTWRITMLTPPKNGALRWLLQYFSQEELWLVKAWGTAGGCHQLQSGGVQREVFDSGDSSRRRALGEGRSSWAGQLVWRSRCWGCERWIVLSDGVAGHYNENRVPVLGYTLVPLKTMKSLVDMR